MTPRSSPASAPPSVLVVGTDDWAVEQVASRLGDSGCRTLTCHPAGQPAFPCNALVEGRVCPLDAGFEVVVNVRARPLDQPSPGEMGATCGLRAGASLVIAGMAGRNPFLPWASRSVGPDDSITEVVAQALAGRRAGAVSLVVGPGELSH